MTQTEWAVIAIVSALTFTFLGIFTKLRAAAMFIGICVVGLAGTAGGWIARILGDVTSLAGQGVSHAFGVSLTAGGLIIAVPLAIIFIHDLHPKKGGHKRAIWVGAALACMCLAGVTGVQMLNQLPGSVQQGVTSTVNGGTSTGHGGGH